MLGRFILYFTVWWHHGVERKTVKCVFQGVPPWLFSEIWDLLLCVSMRLTNPRSCFFRPTWFNSKAQHLLLAAGHGPVQCSPTFCPVLLKSKHWNLHSCKNLWFKRGKKKHFYIVLVLKTVFGQMTEFKAALFVWFTRGFLWQKMPGERPAEEGDRCCLPSQTVCSQW